MQEKTPTYLHSWINAECPKALSKNQWGLKQRFSKGIWELHNKITSHCVSLKDKDEDLKFVLCYMKLGINDYVKIKFKKYLLQP
jgi:hypothetical protein